MLLERAWPNFSWNWWVRGPSRRTRVDWAGFETKMKWEGRIESSPGGVGLGVLIDFRGVRAGYE